MNKKKFMNKIKEIGGEMISQERINCNTYHGSRECVNCGRCMMTEEDIFALIAKIDENLANFDKIAGTMIGLDYDGDKLPKLPESDDDYPCRGCQCKDVPSISNGRLVCVQANDNAKYYAPCEAQEVDKMWVPNIEEDIVDFDMHKSEEELKCEGCPQHEFCLSHNMIGTCYKDED